MMRRVWKKLTSVRRDKVLLVSEGHSNPVGMKMAVALQKKAVIVLFGTGTRNILDLFCFRTVVVRQVHLVLSWAWLKALHMSLCYACNQCAGRRLGHLP